MKSQAKVKSQRRIKSIPPFCDNPLSKEDIELQEQVKKGIIQITKSMPRRVEKTPLRRHQAK